MVSAVVELREEFDEEAPSPSFVHLRDIDGDVAEWWCHYILGQPSGINTFPLLEQLEQIIPRLLPLSKEHNHDLAFRMRALQVWQEFLADPLHVEVDSFSKLAERFEKVTTQDYQHVLRSLQVLGQLLVLRLVCIQRDDPEQITQARNSYTDHLTKIYDKEEIPEPLLAVAIEEEEEEGSGHQAIANLVEDKQSPFGAFQVQEALRKLLLKWCNELETPRFIQLGYRRVLLEEEEEEDFPMTQESHSYNTRSRQSTEPKSHEKQQKLFDDDDDDSDETEEIKHQQSDETWIGGRDSEDVKVVWSHKSKKRGRGRSSPRIPPPLMRAFSSSSSDEDLHDRKRSKSMPSTLTNTATTTNRKRGRVQLKTSRSRSVSAPRAYKKKKPLPEQVTDAIRNGVAKYGHGNWTIIQKRSGGILKHLTGADIKEHAMRLAELGMLG
jgi:hypothetical protein